MITMKLVPPIKVVMTIDRTRPDEDVFGVALKTASCFYGGNLNWKVDFTQSQGSTIVVIAEEQL